MTDYKELIERLKFQTEDTISDHAYIHVLLMEAADAIEELLNANRWTPVSEGLPKEDIKWSRIRGKNETDIR